MFNFFPKMEDSTPVYHYMVTLVEYEGAWLGGKDLVQITTWGQMKKHWPKDTSIPKKVFGLDEPMYVLDIYITDRTTRLVRTKNQILEHLNNLPLMPAEDQKGLINSIQTVRKLGPEIEVMEANLSRLYALIKAMEETRTSL